MRSYGVQDGGVMEYFSIIVFENCFIQLVCDYYMDSDFWVGWDKILVQYRQLEVCLIIGIEVGLMVKKFFFMIVREYIFVWCLWEGED